MRENGYDVMRKKYWNRLSRIFAVCAVVSIVAYIPAIASATCIASQQSCSGNYGVSQTGFSSGSVEQCPLHTGSTYCANASVGDLSDGNIASGNAYQANAGTGLTTNRAPYLSFSVGGVSQNLGYLSASSTSDLVANFTVETYLAGGYIVQVDAPPPTDNVPGNHIMNIPGTPTASSIGTEQFGINLAANTTPAGLGAAPTCTPSTGSFCPTAAMASSITSNYNQVNKYYYPSSGMNYTDTLVNANISTGAVSYTVSFVYNISTTTPDGQYTYNGKFIATSTF